MSQSANQEVPSTPQLGTLLVQQDEGFNQRVPSQEYYLQDDDFSLVPRTPNTRFAEEQQRTPVSTPLSRQRSTPDYGAFLIDHFRTPTVNAPIPRLTSSPSAQVVPGTPDCPQLRRCLGTASPAVRSPLVAAALKTPTQTDWNIRSPTSPGISQSDASNSPFLHPGITETPTLRQQMCKNGTPGSVTPKSRDLRKKVLSRNHTRLAPEKLYFASKLCDSGSNSKTTDCADDLTKRFVEGGGMLTLLHGVVHRLQEDESETGTGKTQLRIPQANQSENSNDTHHNEDLLDIIDKTD